MYICSISGRDAAFVYMNAESEFLFKNANQSLVRNETCRKQLRTESVYRDLSTYSLLGLACVKSAAKHPSSCPLFPLIFVFYFYFDEYIPPVPFIQPPVIIRVFRSWQQRFFSVLFHCFLIICCPLCIVLISAIHWR